MSAVAWDPADLGSVGARAPRRPQLVVLPGGREGGAAAPAAAVRITRRGRLALLALALATAGVLGLTGLSGAGAAEPLTVVTVAPGQTLSEIAATQLPDLSVSTGIVAIQVANELNSAQVSAGQQLVIPAG
ncbi:LysM peptidoglycan-binding domain-containing protein [Oryzobacter terrae]|uniref:LysM peptidoglycan-binding domain-containing protein n=1 Tax=Oryzobacter terrae TaxID=1620385 RepID=UPI0036727576